MSEAVVHIIDDDAAMRDSLAFLLQVNRIPYRIFESAVAFLEDLPEDGGCVLSDVRMPQMNGIEMVRKLKELDYRAPIIVMTGHADVPLAVEAMKAGVADFIEKPFDDEVLLAAIAAALRDGEKDRQGAAEAAEISARMDILSGREREVLGGLVAGHANKVIAFDLGISPRTVEIYRANVMTKMKAASLSELVRMAMLAERG